jgi:ketosteroid isomerase-like protein
MIGGEYNNQYCWVVGFNKIGKIESVRAYLDTAKLRDVLEKNE